MAAVALNLAVGAFLVHADGHDGRGAGFLGVLRFWAWRDVGCAAGGVCGLFWTSGIGYDTWYHRAVYDVGTGCGSDDSGLIFDFVGSSYLPFFYGAGFVGVLAAVASLFAVKPVN